MSYTLRCWKLKLPLMFMWNNVFPERDCTSYLRQHFQWAASEALISATMA